VKRREGASKNVKNNNKGEGKKNQFSRKWGSLITFGETYKSGCINYPLSCAKVRKTLLLIMLIADDKS